RRRRVPAVVVRAGARGYRLRRLVGGCRTGAHPRRSAALAVGVRDALSSRPAGRGAPARRAAARKGRRHRPKSVRMDAVERSIETQVSQAVDVWLRWLPRWEPATHRGRVAPCRRCFGSPVLSAAGLGADVPHGVQHGLSTRMKTIVDHAVAEYTSRNL